MTRPRFEQFYALRRPHLLSNLTFSPDGREISYTHDGSGQYNLWRQGVRGGYPVQLTSLEEEAARFQVWTRHGFVLAIDRHGNEQMQVHRLGAEGGWPEDLTGRTDCQYLFSPEGVDPGGDRLAIAGNAIRPTDVSVFELHLPTGQMRTLLEAEGLFYPRGWHPDGRRLLVEEFLGNHHQEVFLYDPAAGERRYYTSQREEQVNHAIGFDKKGQGFYLVTDRDWDHAWLAYQPLHSGALQKVWQGEWGVHRAALARSQRTLAWIVIEDGFERLYVRDLEAGRDLPVPELPPGAALHLAVSPDGRRVALTLSTATRGFDVYLLDLRTGELERITQNFLGGIPETELVKPELVRYPTFDGRQVPAWLYRPPSANGPLPALLSIHGGPEAQERPAYIPLYQYLLSRGVAVLAPNIRGSTGYGKSYQALIRRDWGGGELKDIRAAAEFLRSLPWVDRNRLGVYGGSFGGFATLSAMTRLPEYWACGVDLVGPSNLVTFTRAVPPHWRASVKRWVGDPDQDAELLTQRSPITYADQIRAPLLVLQGANDPRVVKGESDQMVERLRQRGVPVEYHVFEDEGHGFTKRRNQLHAQRLAADFLLRHLEVDGD